MKLSTVDRADLEADAVTSILAGQKVLIVSTSVDAGAGIFRTIADAFVDDAGDMVVDAQVRRTKGRERLDLPGGGRLYMANARTADLSVRGMAVDRIYTPAGTSDKLLRIYEAVTIQSPRPVVLTYADPVDVG